MNKIDQAGRELLALDSKVALLGTTDDEGCPHLTFLSSIQGLGEDRITFGQFSTGTCKEFVTKRPDCAFLALTADMRWLRGNMRYTHKSATGPEFDMYNNKPLFRYNSYFGINTVWYFDLLGVTGVRKLPALKVGMGALLSRAAAPLCKKSDNNALTLFSRELFSELIGPKFLCFAKADGQLTIVPIIQACNAGTDRVAISGLPYGADLKELPAGARVAVLALNLKMQSVLVKGTFTGKKGGACVINIDRVYNSMPPAAGYIYPKRPLPEAMTEF